MSGRTPRDPLRVLPGFDPYQYDEVLRPGGTTWVVIDEISDFKPEAFDLVRSIREDRARRDWMHAAGMV